MSDTRKAFEHAKNTITQEHIDLIKAGEWTKIRLVEHYDVTDHYARKLVKWIEAGCPNKVSKDSFRAPSDKETTWDPDLEDFDTDQEESNMDGKDVHDAIAEDSLRVEFNEDSGRMFVNGNRVIKSKEDLLEVGDVDLDKYFVKDFDSRAWGVTMRDENDKIVYNTNYYVALKLKLRGIDEPDDHFTKKWMDELVSRMPDKYKTVPDKPVAPNSKPLVLVIADTHIGLLTEDMKVVPDYNIEKCRDKLKEIAATVNALGRPVYVVHLGDLIESFNGKNKKNTWKRIEKHGADVALAAYDVFDEFFDSLKHFQDAIIMGGNHDRSTRTSEADPDAEIAKIINGIFERVGKYDTSFDPLVLTKEVDGIEYICMHGDKKIAKQDASRLVIDYGNSNIFNLILSAHIHHREVFDDAYKFRFMTCPPIVPGKKYEEDAGWNSTTGFLMVEERNGKPYVHDIPLN
jgi:metallophosphoesterase superfamily enzyme